MSTLIKKDFPLGWIPCDDEINGRTQGLIRADNLVQDENGIWTLMRGTKKVSSGPQTNLINRIYSRYLNGKKLRYISTNGAVFRNYGGAGTLTDFDSGTIASGGDASYTTFGTGFGHNFIISGSKKKKDNGVNTDNSGAGNASFDLGITAPSAPTLSVENPYPKDVSEKNGANFDYWVRLEPTGTETYNDASDYIEIESDPTTYRAVAIVGINPPHAVAMNAKDLTGAGYKGYDSDIFKINVRIEDTATFIGVRVEYLLDTPTAAGYGEDIKNFYYKEWGHRIVRGIEGTAYDPLSADRIPTDITPSELTTLKRSGDEAPGRFQGLSFSEYFRQGINVWTTLTAQRSEFQRVGTDDALDWGTVKGIKVIFTGIAQQTYVFNDLIFEGGPLTGHFTYKQVNVYDNGDYQEFGLPSVDTAEYQVINAGVKVTYNYTVSAGNQVNRIWIYRRSEFTGGFYKVKEVTAPAVSPNNYFIDSMSDAEALQLNQQLPAYATALPDYIYGMVADYFGRNLYITARDVIPSYKDNPGLYDSRFVLDIGGDEAEFNLFIAKVSNSSILIGTTKDIYELTGNGSEVELVDGSIILDFQLRPLGVSTPPVCDAFCVYDSTLIYLAHDGWHRLVGSSNEVFSQELSLLYQKQNRHGINQVLVPIANSSVAMCTISKGKFWACVDHDTIGRAMHVFNFKTKTWEFRRFGSYGQNPQAIFTEEDGSILYSTTSAGDKYLREYDVGTLFDESANIDFLYRTTFDDDNKPRNRKDLFTVRASLNTGNVPVNLAIRAMDDSSTVYEKTYVEAFNGVITKTLDLNLYISTPVKRIQVEISGVVPLLQIREISIAYDERPEQLNFLIIRPSNFGIAGRKRIPLIPFIVDTLNGNVTFTPVIDRILKAPLQINTGDKEMIRYYFNPAETGYMIGGILANGIFEFYEMIPPREIELLPDPVKYKYTNESNLGTSCRKRIVQYARMIDTRGSDVTMTPSVDGITYPSLIINSSRKKTHIYTFQGDVTGVDISCFLSGNNEFEDYGENLEECVWEKLPRVTRFVNLSTTNFGIANKKRVRTIPIVINTLGGTVTYQPQVDGLAYPPTQLQSIEKRTLLHYFAIDSFGIDYGGTLSSNSDFEFYEMLKPEIVQILPVSKLFDQLGPIEFNKVGKLKELRLRIVPEGTSIAYQIFSADSSILTGNFNVTPNIENIYTIKFPRGINPTICRVTLLSSNPWHRLSSEFKVHIEGRESEYKWINEMGEEV